MVESLTIYPMMLISVAGKLLLKFKVNVKNKIPEYLVGVIMNFLNAERVLPKISKLKKKIVFYLKQNHMTQRTIFQAA